MIPTINKPTRVTKKTATSIDHIITNSFVENTFKTAIIKSGVSVFFPVWIFISSTNLFTKNHVIYQHKRTITLSKMCSNMELFLVRIFLYSDWIPVLSPNTGKYGPEINPYLDTFHAVLMIKKLKLFFKISINMTGIPWKLIGMQMKLTIILD